MSHKLCGSPTVTSVIAVIAVVVCATPSQAGSQDLSPTRHVRARDARIAALIEDGARRSPLFRSLLEIIEQSSAIVYVESRMLPAALAGRLTLAGSGGPWRYVRIEIECRRSLDSQIATLGHELQHAVEVAEERAIVDQHSLQALYGRIGFAIDHRGRQFESHAAREAGDQVRRELSSRVTEISSR